jgi:hypothetical protein|eukprot:scaffold2716_cov202-Alexandrium_tamarense.AAC.16
MNAPITFSNNLPGSFKGTTLDGEIMSGVGCGVVTKRHRRRRSGGGTLGITHSSNTNMNSTFNSSILTSTSPTNASQIIVNEAFKSRAARIAKRRSSAASSSLRESGKSNRSVKSVGSKKKNAQQKKKDRPTTLCMSHPADMNISITNIGELDIRTSVKNEYELGDKLKSIHDMILPPLSPPTSLTVTLASKLAASLKIHDFAFVRRSDGSWRYAILAGTEGHTSDNGTSPSSELHFKSRQEESMIFVMNNVGSTKSIPRSHWGHYVRRVRGNCDDLELIELADGLQSTNKRDRDTSRRVSSVAEKVEEEASTNSEEGHLNDLQGIIVIAEDDGDDAVSVLAGYQLKQKQRQRKQQGVESGVQEGQTQEQEQGRDLLDPPQKHQEQDGEPKLKDQLSDLDVHINLLQELQHTYHSRRRGAAFHPLAMHDMKRMLFVQECTSDTEDNTSYSSC